MIGVGLLDRYSYLDVRCDCGCQLFEGVLKANLEGLGRIMGMHQGHSGDSLHHHSNFHVSSTPFSMIDLIY